MGSCSLTLERYSTVAVGAKISLMDLAFLIILMTSLRSLWLLSRSTIRTLTSTIMPFGPSMKANSSKTGNTVLGLCISRMETNLVDVSWMILFKALVSSFNKVKQNQSREFGLTIFYASQTVIFDFDLTTFFFFLLIIFDVDRDNNDFS